MMQFLSERLWGVKWIIWIYFGMSVILFLGVLIYFYRERIRGKYYKIRFPEKLVKVIIHYPGGMFKPYWRLIPDKRGFSIDGKMYQFNKDDCAKMGEFFANPKKDKKPGNAKEQEYIIKVDGKEYDLIESNAIKWRWDNYIEAHYFYNVPGQIKFKCNEKQIELSATELQEMTDKNLFIELLTIDGGKPLLILIIGICAITLVGVILTAGKIYGFIGGA